MRTVGEGTQRDTRTYAEVLRTQRYLPIFSVNALSTWGDFIARITVAAIVLDRTGSDVATAATFAVSLLPTVFGRTLLSPLADRLPYRDVLVGSHLARAVMVGLLMVAVVGQWPVAVLLLLLFLLELFGGPAPAASQILLTDLFTDRRLFAKAFGLNALAEQANQAIGLAVGGALVATIGAEQGLAFDLVTFLVGAVVLLWCAPRKVMGTESQQGLSGFFRDMVGGARHLAGDPLLRMLMAVSLLAVPAMAGPEAVALVYARQELHWRGFGGLLMAAPMVGALVGLSVASRWAAERQNDWLIWTALAMPLPLLVTVAHPPPVVLWLSWFLSGVLQTFMLPLQATFSLLVPPGLRGRVFGLAGSLSVTSMGVAYLFAGWVSQHSTPGAAVGVCAVISFGALLLLAATWPRQALADAVHRTYNAALQPEEATGAAAAAVVEPSASAVVEPPDGAAGAASLPAVGELPTGAVIEPET